FSDSTSYPAYAVVNPTGKADYIWSPSTNDVRALQRATSGRIAACWYAGQSFDVDVNFSDQSSHRVALYFLDWDGGGRATRVDVLNAQTLQVLSTQTVSSYFGGTYAIWNVQGHVIFRLTNLNGQNAVLSGLFFDPVVSGSTFTLSGTVTAGGNALSGVSFA